jgi:hypothetical protein
MDDLRSEIRAAFEREQAGHAPSGAMRGQVVEAVVSGSRPSRNFQWVAVVAAVLLGVAVVVGLMATRNAHRATAPAATPNASPVADYGPPPVGVKLLYVRDPNHPSWLIGYDWSGKPRATVKLDPAVDRVGMAPDGQAFAVGYGAKGGTGELLDRLGRPVPASGAIGSSALPMWADDNRHVCGISFESQTLESTLITVAPGEAVKRVAAIARDQVVGQSGFTIVSCSFRNDEAILVLTNTMWPSEVWTVRLSDGKVISRHTYPNLERLSNIVASADASFIAENSSKSSGQLMGQTAASTIIRRHSDWSVVATFDPSVGVVAFSSDDSLVLAYTTPWVGGVPTRLAVIEVQSGRMLWTYSGPGMLGGAVAQPGGQDFAIYVRKPAVEDPLTDLMIVHSDGTAADFPSRYTPTW